MGVFAFDTHKAVKQLKEAGFDDHQAEAVTTLFWDTRALELENLASKTDLESLRLELKADYAALRDTMATKEELAELRDTMATKEDLAMVKADVATLKDDLATLKDDVASLRLELREETARLHTEIAQSKMDTIKWMVPMVVTQVIATVGLIRLLG